MQSIYQDLDFNICCIDTEHMRKNFVASYLIEDSNRAAFIDTGCYFSVAKLLATLDAKGIAYDCVDYILLTHIHLDHAGGAGELLRHLPNAKVYVHERGYQHLVDPSKLRSGVIDVYGELFFKQFLGDLIPIDESRIVIANDNDSIILGNRKLKFINTPGHAKHHVCIWDEYSQGVFSGDTLGVSYRELDNKKGVMIFPPTSPIQFDPQTWKNTIERLDALNPKYAYLTHFCRIEWSTTLSKTLAKHIDDFVKIARHCKHDTNRHQAIKTALLAFLLNTTKNHGVVLDTEQQTKIFKGDIEICAQGLGVWLDKEN